MSGMKRQLPRLLGVAMGTTLLIAGATWGARAEQTNPSRTAGAGTPETGQADRSVLKRSPKPPAHRAASSGNERSNANKPWSIEDALPKNSRAVPPVQPDAKSTDLGRVPLRSNGGTFGIETDPQYKSGDFAGSRNTPSGLDTAQHRPQYLGLSLSVPTPDKSIVPPALVPPWARPE